MLFKGQISYVKVDMPKINTIYHGHTFEATKRMVVVDSVGFRFNVGFGYRYLKYACMNVQYYPRGTSNPHPTLRIDKVQSTLISRINFLEILTP